MQIAPANAQAWINLAVAQFHRDRYADGIDACRHALEVEPDNSLATFNLALAHEHLRRYDKAMLYVRRGLEKDPKDASLQKMELRLRVLQIRAKVVRTLRWVVGKR